MRSVIFESIRRPGDRYAVVARDDQDKLTVLNTYPNLEQLENGYKDSLDSAHGIVQLFPVEFVDTQQKSFRILYDLLLEHANKHQEEGESRLLGKGEALPPCPSEGDEIS
ncbi:MAG TPA: hypothetical protein VJA47_04785 [archaeon]|nr:hypothetical protein [archaeon]